MGKHDLAANNFLVPNATFIAEVIAFLLILAIIAKWIMPYITRPLAERQKIIEQQMADADATKAKLAEAEQAYQQALTEARVEAAQIRENARAEAQRTIEEVRVQAQEESARILARGEEQLTRQRSAIVRELRAEVGSMAVALSEKIIDQRLAEDANIRATVDSFLAGIAADQDATEAAGGDAAQVGGSSS